MRKFVVVVAVARISARNDRMMRGQAQGGVHSLNQIGGSVTALNGLLGIPSIMSFK
jgi:hypothetical protein